MTNNNITTITMDDLINPQHHIFSSSEFVHSNFTLSSAAMRILYATMSLISNDDVDFQTYRIRAIDIIKFYHKDISQGYPRVIRAINELKKATIKISEADQKISVYPIVDKIDYIDSSIIIRLSKHLKPHLLATHKNQNKYTYADFPFSGLLSIDYRRLYSLRLFHLLLFRSNTDCVISIDDLRYILNSEHYNAFGVFNNKVIKPAIAEINALSPYNVEIVQIRSNNNPKFIDSLQFSMTRKSQ